MATILAKSSFLAILIIFSPRSTPQVEYEKYVPVDSRWREIQQLAHCPPPTSRDHPSDVPRLVRGIQEKANINPVPGSRGQAVGRRDFVISRQRLVILLPGYWMQ